MISLVWLGSLASAFWVRVGQRCLRSETLPPLGTRTRQTWKTNAQKKTIPRVDTKLSIHTLLFLHTCIQQQTHKTTHTPLQGLKRTNLLRRMYEHTSTHCPSAHTHTCKNNKANLVKGVGGEAARQKDINSLSEFNNRGGGGSRDKYEEEEERERDHRRERKGKTKAL